MLPLLNDEESLIERLETRVGQLAALLQSLNKRCVEMDKELHAALEERDAALSQAQAAQAENAKLIDDIAVMRAKQQDAATRVRGLLEQIDRLGLFESSQES